MKPADKSRRHIIYPELDVPNPAQFLDDLELEVERSRYWNLQTNYAEFRAIVTEFAGPASAFNGKGLGISAYVDDKFIEVPAANTICFAVVAAHWGANNRFGCASDKDIRKAFGLFLPLVKSVCCKLSVNCSVKYPKHRPRYRLKPVTSRLLDAFCLLANTSCLHPYDWERYFEFIHFCHAHSVRLGPGRLKQEFAVRNFPEQLATALAERYSFGRSLLAKDSLGWTDETL